MNSQKQLINQYEEDGKMINLYKVGKRVEDMGDGRWQLVEKEDFDWGLADEHRREVKRTLSRRQEKHCMICIA